MLDENTPLLLWNLNLNCPKKKVCMTMSPVFVVKENVPNTCYLTVGGYLVTLDKNLIAPPNLCPGESAMGNKPTSGWRWQADGKIVGLQPTWGEKLQIVKLIDFPIPKPPAGYKYIDGYPQWRAPKAGEWFAESDTYVEKTYKDLSASYLIVSPVTKEDCVDITDSHPNLIPREGIDYYDGPIHQFQITEKGSIRKTIKEWRESYCKFRHYCLPEHVPPKEEALRELNKAMDEEYPQYYIPENTELFAYIEVTNKDKYRCVRINGELGSEVSVNLTKFENRKKITKEEALARVSKTEAFTPAPPKITNLCVEIAGPPQSRFSYWVIEPIGNMYGAAKNSVRYIVISSVLAAIGYTAYNPAQAIGFVKSCLPKVNIEWRTPK